MQSSVMGISLDGADRDRVEYAVEESDFESAEDLVQEATARLVSEILDEDGPIECPHDDCEETFPTQRKLRGHLGSSEHALDVPEGDFWCGYCGYGPTSWRGVNAHHGSSDHDGEAVRLDEEPGRDDLLAPDDVPDHKNPELLERLYRKHGGSYTEMCRQHDFDVTDGRVRHYLIEFGIHEVTPHGELDDGPVYRDREWLQERYDDADGNVSEMHRSLDIDVPYRTLLKNLNRFGIHDKTDPPGKRHGKGGPAPERQQSPSEDSGEDAVDEVEPEPLDHDDQDDLLEAFEEHDTISDAADRFSASYATVRQRMIDHGIYTPDTYDAGDGDEGDTEEPSTGPTREPDPEPQPEPQPEPVPEPAPEPTGPEAVLGIDDPEDVESFHDLDTPDWLDEASLYTAAEMADDVDELSEVLGWAEHEQLEVMVEVLDLQVTAP